MLRPFQIKTMADAWADAIEAMADLPIKGHVPSEVDIASVVKKSREAFVSKVDGASGRQLPTQAEIAAIVAAASGLPAPSKAASTAASSAPTSKTPAPIKKKPSSSTDESCGHCGSAASSSLPGGKLSKCARCGTVAYCSKDCQRAHWKAGHKQFCVPKADRMPSQYQSSKAATAAGEQGEGAIGGEECAVCLEPLGRGVSVALPCAHAFHAVCVNQLRDFGLHNGCPLCRAPLPPGPEKLADEATRR